PFPHGGATKSHRQGCCRRKGGHRHRHSPSAFQRRGFLQAGIACSGRGTAFRRGTQGKNQSAQNVGGRAYAVGNADTSHIAHGAFRHKGHFHHNNASRGKNGGGNIRGGGKRRFDLRRNYS